MNNYDYKNKVIYLGIDVHKKTYSCVGVCEGLMVKSDTMPANAKHRVMLRSGV